MIQILAYSMVLLLGGIIIVAVRRAPATALGRPLISAYTVVIGLFTIYLFVPALMLLFQDGEYVWLPLYGGYERLALTAFVCVAALVCFLGAYWLRQGPSQGSAEFAPYRRPRLEPVVLAWVLIVVGVLLKLYTLYAAGGMEGSAVRLSRGLRDALGIEELSSSVVMIRYLSGIADASIVWLILHQLRSRRIALFHFLVLLAVVCLSFFGTGKRLFIMWPILAILLGAHYYHRPLRIHLAPFAVGFVILAGFATLMFRIYLPAQTADVEIDLYAVRWARGSLLNFYFLSLEFGSFEILTLAIENSESVIRPFGGAVNAFYMTNIQPLFYLVPRALWPGKPEYMVDMAHAYRVVAFGGDLTSGGGINGMLVSTSWSFAGPAGVALAMFFLGYLAASLDAARKVRGLLSPVGIAWYAFAIVTVFHLFRQGTVGWVVMIMVFQQMGVLLALPLLSFFDRVPAPRARRAASKHTRRSRIASGCVGEAAPAKPVRDAIRLRTRRGTARRF